MTAKSKPLNPEPTLANIVAIAAILTIDGIIKSAPKDEAQEIVHTFLTLIGDLNNGRRVDCKVNHAFGKMLRAIAENDARLLNAD